MTTIYLAAPLFNEAELDFNKKLAQKLENAGYEVYLPQENEDKPAADEVTSHKLFSIYRNDLEYLDDADVVVAVADGADMDSGTAFEVGWAKAKYKPIFVLRTDIRKQNKAEFVNLMIQCAADDVYFDIDSLLMGLHVYLDEE